MRHDRRFGAGWLAAPAFFAGICSAGPPEIQIPMMHVPAQRVIRLAPDIPAASAEFADVDSKAGARMDVHIVYSAEGVTSEVQGPGGEIIRPTDLKLSNKGEYIRYEGGESTGFLMSPFLGPGIHEVYKFPSWGPGKYTVNLKCAVPPTKDIAVIVELSGDTTIVVGVTAIGPPSGLMTSGTEITLVAAAFDGSKGMFGADVSATVMSPNREKTALPMLDNGVAPDGAVGDGLYFAKFTPKEAGEYFVMVEVTGRHQDGTSYVRSGGTGFEVSKFLGKISNSFRDFGKDENDNGLFDWLIIEMRDAELEQAGEYSFHVNLKSASGKFIGGGGRTNVGAPGRATLTARIPAESIRETGEDGPYTIDVVSIDYHGSDFADTVDFAAEGTTKTSAYKLNQFERPPIIFIGELVESSEDTDGDGDVDSLEVTLGIDVLYAAKYRYQATLGDQCTPQRQKVHGNADLKANGPETISLSFDGSIIGMEGIDGPYTLENFIIWTHVEGHKLPPFDIEHAGKTKQYAARDFDSYAAFADCNENDKPDLCDITKDASVDRDFDGVPDECGDCNKNGTIDYQDLAQGASKDCNGNRTPDECEICAGSSAPGGPFFCERFCNPDRNNNGVPDVCDAGATKEDRYARPVDCPNK